MSGKNLFIRYKNNSIIVYGDINRYQTDLDVLGGVKQDKCMVFDKKYVDNVEAYILTPEVSSQQIINMLCSMDTISLIKIKSHIDFLFEKRRKIEF